MADTAPPKLTPKRRRAPTQARSRETVAAILEAGARVFDRVSIGGKATTNAIARVAGVSIGSLYEYFPNKEAILASLLSDHVEDAQARLQEALARLDPHSSPLEPSVRSLIELLLALHVDRRGLHRRLIEQWMGESTGRREVAQAEQRLRLVLVDWLAVHPEVRCADLEWTARLIVEGTNAMVHRYVEDDEGQPREAFVDALAKLWAGYLRTA